MSAPDSGAKQSGARVFAVVGDRYHNADYIRTHLNRLFGELEMPYDYTIDFREITPERLAQYDVFLFFRDGLLFPDGYIGPDAFPYAERLMNDPPTSERKTWVTDEMGHTIKQYVEGGGGLYSMHNNPNVANYSETYREIVGGIYDGHPAVRPFRVEVVNHDHPITAGVEDFNVVDEQHYPIYDKDPQYVLLRSVNIDGLTFGKRGTSNIAAWAYDYGKGRVVHSAPGHNLYALWRPSYLTFQKNAISWLLRQS